MVARVALALVGACTARCQARLKRIELRWGMGIGLPAEYPDRGDACVRAVEAEADAADQVTHVVLGHACVRADRAGRLARAALVEASRQHRDIGDHRSRVGSEDLLDAHGLLLVVARVCYAHDRAAGTGRLNGTASALMAGSPGVQSGSA
jgi:hypothetical protein